MTIALNSNAYKNVDVAKKEAELPLKVGTGTPRDEREEGSRAV